MSGEQGSPDLRLRDGSRVGVVGGGPAGSLFAFFLLSMAARTGLKLRVDIYEPRDFARPGPSGCNMCGGIVSESLVQELSTLGIRLPEGLVRRTIDSYVLHTESGSVKIDAPRRGKTTAAVQRGGGPGGLHEVARGGLDSHLLSLAIGLGARVEAARVREAGWNGDRPQLRLQDGSRDYDLIVGATGVNSAGWRFFEQLGLPDPRPRTARAFIAEMGLGQQTISRYFGNSMHILLLDMPHLEFAALIPKGEYLTVVLLGQEVTPDLARAFFSSPAMERCLPGGWNLGEAICHCSPHINLREARTPFGDRVVLVGDCGVTRLYKDGLGAAYHTAKAAASTAVYHGVSSADFRRYYWPTYRGIALDNRFGELIFSLVHQIKTSGSLVKGVLKTADREQNRPTAGGPMSTVLWDMFTGAAPYRHILRQALHPRLIGRYIWESVAAAGQSLHRKSEESGLEGVNHAPRPSSTLRFRR
jgi:flavin-dependent dehydrogenase